MRETAIAVRCHLLVGGWEGATRVCPCLYEFQCPLSTQQRADLANHPKVIEARARNREEYEAHAANPQAHVQ